MLPPERLAAEMERVRRNVLTQWSRDDFEALVKRAACAADAAKTPPRLVEALPRSLAGNGLVGSAEWKIIHTGSGSGRLALNPLQLALRSARWPDNRPALLGAFDDRPNAALELLVEKPGESTLALEWSAPGLPEPTGLRFDLRWPPCPLATLELALPADVVPQADRDGYLVSGPFSVRGKDEKFCASRFRAGRRRRPIPSRWCCCGRCKPASWAHCSARSFKPHRN